MAGLKANLSAVCGAPTLPSASGSASAMVTQLLTQLGNMLQSAIDRLTGVVGAAVEDVRVRPDMPSPARNGTEGIDWAALRNRLPKSGGAPPACVPAAAVQLPDLFQQMAGGAGAEADSNATLPGAKSNR